jgi:tetratricopeptide (TPR) repeat protein
MIAAMRRKPMTLRLPLAMILSVVLCAPAHASGRGDLKAGYAALLRQDYGKAIGLLTSAIEAGDLNRNDTALAYQYRGAGHLKTGHYDEAIADFDGAIGLQPKLPTAYSDRGIAFRRKGEYAKAIADYSEAIRLWPHWHDWYLNRGLAYAANGQYEDAIADYGRALYYKPDLVAAFLARADAHLEQGRKDEALADYRRALKERSDLLKVYPGLAAKLSALGATR